MVKKLTTLLKASADNEYILSIGPIKRPDPKDEMEDEVAQVIVAPKPKALDEVDEMISEYSLTDEEDRQQKRVDQQQKMLERRLNRKSGSIKRPS